MASAADICNIGLSHIGADAVVVSISPPDGSVEAGHCARFYKIARLEVIDLGDWAFTKHRVQLAEVTNDSQAWDHAYARPSDMVSPLRIFEDGQADEAVSADFVVDGQVIRTNAADAVLLYKRDITDTTKFPPRFVTAMGKIMAGYLAGPLIKGLEGANVGVKWLQAGRDEAALAQASDANHGQHDAHDMVPSSIAARA